MAEQRTSKARKQAAPSRARNSRADYERSKLDGRLAAVEAERDRLRMDLDAALERIAMLEQVNADVSDRIAWVIDSLQNSAKA